MISSKKILIAEDDLVPAEYLKEILEESGYEVVGITDTGLGVIEQFKRVKPDLVLMDIMLKGNISGCEAALEIKRDHSDAKIIFLTAFATSEMIEYAVESEAYGYLTKPYREEEILATIRLALSHHAKEEPVAHKEIIALQDGYIYNTLSNRLMKGDKEIPLSKKSLKLMEILIKNRNTSVSKEQICSFIWGKDKSDCTLRSLIHRIRTTIGSDIIKNVNGVGYEITA